MRDAEIVLQFSKTYPEQQRGARFFILHRITFSGVVESGGYSQQAFATRFTESAIQRVAELGKYL